MDSEYPHDPKFDLHPETWVIDRIVLFTESTSAQLFMQHVFPINCNCIIVSRDGVYPRNPELRARVESAVRENPKLRVAVFNVAALRGWDLVSDRVLVMDEFIMQDFKHHPAERLNRLDFNPTKIAFMIDCFFNQWDRIPRAGNVAFAYRNFKEYRELDWKADLIAGPSQSS